MPSRISSGSSPRASTATWTGSPARRRGAPIRRCCGRTRARSIMLGMNYGPDRDPLAILAQRDRGAISVYAQGDDYHDLIKSRLKAVARCADRERRRRREGVRRHRGRDGKAARGERPGSAGRASTPTSFRASIGSWLFLGAIFTTLELAPDDAEIDHCGTCSACLDVCPTNAFPAPYRLDARRCISYLTIEHKGPIPRELRPLMGNRIYGCDDCLAVCPWNKFAQAGREAKLAARETLARARTGRARAARRRGVPRAVREVAGQAHRPRPLRAQCADRDRQFGRRQRSRRRPSGCSMMPRRWCAARRSGRSGDWMPRAYAWSGANGARARPTRPCRASGARPSPSPLPP